MCCLRTGQSRGSPACSWTPCLRAGHCCSPPALAACAAGLTVLLTGVLQLAHHQPVPVWPHHTQPVFPHFSHTVILVFIVLLLWVVLVFCFLYEFSSWWQSSESVSKRKRKRFCSKDLIQPCKKLNPDQIFQKHLESHSCLPPSFLISSSCCPGFFFLNEHCGNDLDWSYYINYPSWHFCSVWKDRVVCKIDAPRTPTVWQQVAG